MKEQDDANLLDVDVEETGERLIPHTAPRTVWMQHVGRYYFAIPRIAGQTVLDCACGVGFGTHILTTNGARMAVGVDLSENAVCFARRHYGRSGAAYSVMDAHDLAFQESSFDVVVSFETMEHLTSPERFLQGVVYCLKQNGQFIASVPNRDALPNHVEYFSPFHVREFNLSQLRHLLSRYFEHSSFYCQPWHDREVVYRKRYLAILRKVGLGWLRPYVPRFAKRIVARIAIDPIASFTNARLGQTAFDPRRVEEDSPLGENDSVLIARCRDPKKLRNIEKDNCLACLPPDGTIC